jgi:hypothetical protein
MKKEEQKEIVEKSIYLISKGFMVSREAFEPDCDISRMILSLHRAGKGRKYFMLQDIMVMISFGWKIFYSGKRSKDMELVKATYIHKDQE